MSSTVLIVASDTTLRGILSDALQALGLRTVGIVDHCAAPGLIRAVVPDLVLLDSSAADPHAMDVLHSLRADATLGRIPLLLLSDRTAAADRVAGLKAGADDYIVKPFDLDELLARVSSHLRRSSREQTLNPLTRLPGHAVVEQAAQERLARQEPFALLYIDLDRFKAYNDSYSFVEGDRLIVELGKLVLTVSREFGAGMPVAHIGGDDFLMLVADPQHAATAATMLIARFDARLPEFYRAEDTARGYVEVQDRRRRQVRSPLVSLSIAIIRYRGEPSVHWGLLAARAGELKQSVKRHEGHGYLLDRRRFDSPEPQPVPQ